MMDFWPWITRGDTFFELYSNAFSYSLITVLFYPVNTFFICLGAFISARFFHKKVIIYSILLTTILAGVIFSTQYYFLGFHISDALFLTLMNVCTLIIASLIGRLFSIYRKKEIKKVGDKSLVSKIESSRFILQALFLSFMNCTLMSVIFFKTIPLLILFIPITALFIYKVLHIKKIRFLELKKYDYILLSFVICLLIIIGFVQIGDFVCSIPWFRDFFSCHMHYF